jgi:hypothetical protein
VLWLREWLTKEVNTRMGIDHHAQQSRARMWGTDNEGAGWSEKSWVIIRT